jgi:hypothetical protein
MAWTPNRILALVLGIVLTLVGIMGFFVSSSMSPGLLLGFQIDLVHNLIHLLSGIVALVAFYTGWSRRFNQIFGIIYLVVALAGLIPALYFDGRLLGIMHVNPADDVLHWVIALAAIIVGFFVHDYTETRATPTV